MHAPAMNAERTESNPESQRLGRYRLLTTLGQGGMGAIHLAVMSGMGEFRKLVVVKELRRDLATNPEFVKLFLSEAKLAGRLNHPNIVQTIEAGQDGERYYLAMEFLDGQPFHTVVQTSRVEPLVPLRLRLQVIRDVLSGLHYAHELCDYDGRPLGIVHCDVSPPNVFLTYDGHVKVVDFGIAKASELNAPAEPGVFKGKLRYAAPEQLIGENIDRRADVFSAGVMLWEAVTLRKFSSGSVQDHAAIERRLLGAEPRLAQAAPGVPHLLTAICDKALSVDPKNRFQTAEDFREALAEYIAAFGAPYDSNAVGQLMATKFAAERAQRHLLIHQRIRNEHAPESQRAPLPSAANDGVPTAVADLSELVESIRLTDGVAASVRGMRKGNPKSLWWVAGTAVVIGAVGTSLIGGKDPEPPTSAANLPLVTGNLTQTLNQLAPEEPKPRDVSPSRPAEAVPADAKLADAKPADAKPADEKVGLSTTVVEVVPTVERTLEPVKVVGEATSKERRREAKEEASADASQERERSARAAAPASSPATPTSAPMAAVTASKKSAPVIQAEGVGQDLRGVPRHEQRGLDEDNPFR